MNIGIAILGYNRPQHLKKVLSSVINQKIKSISIYVDGPENEFTKRKQKEIFDLINKFEKKIKIEKYYQKKNHGLAFSVTNAVTTELKKNEGMILLEDDCVPLPGFFKYMFDALKKYKNKREIKSICSFYNLKHYNNNALFLKRFNPWGWATWKDRWSSYESDIKKEINRIENKGKIDSLPVDLQAYCKNEDILNGKQDIWSLSWTLNHYLHNALIVYPPTSLIENIGFDGTGVHCVKTSIFKVKNQKIKKTFLPTKIRFNYLNDMKFNNFLNENSSKTFFKTKKFDLVEPYSFTKQQDYILKDQIQFYVQKFVNIVPIYDIHTHLFPSNFNKFYKVGLIELLNYHYLVAELLSLNTISPVNFYKLTKYEKARKIWEQLFFNKYPFSTAAVGVLKILQIYGINHLNQKFEKILRITKDNKISENDIFQISGVKKVVMTNNPFDKNEFLVLERNKNSRYVPSIRIDDLFDQKKILNDQSYNLKKGNKSIEFFEKIILKFNPSYFALSTENFNEFNEEFFFRDLMKLLDRFKLPLMLLIGVKRKVNPTFAEAGDGIGTTDITQLEKILLKFPKNKFLVTCLNLNDQFKLTVMSRKFPNLIIFGFWWFNNNESIISDTLMQRFELLGDNFIFQHSDARIIDQLIYKWNDFKKIYIDLCTIKFNNLLSLGYNLKISDIEKKICDHFENHPKKYMEF